VAIECTRKASLHASGLTISRPVWRYQWTPQRNTFERRSRQNVTLLMLSAAQASSTRTHSL
jgi:hypothetical protein